MIVKAVTAREVNDMNLATDLVHDRNISVSEEACATVETPDFIEKSCFAYEKQVIKFMEPKNKNLPESCNPTSPMKHCVERMFLIL